MHSSGVRRREVRLSNILIASCPSAAAYTYATRVGTNIIDDVVVDISIPHEYVQRAVDNATAEVECIVGQNPATDQQKAAMTFTRAVCTLVYASWRGLHQPPYHYNGLKATILQTANPEHFVDQQDAFTKEAMWSVAQNLRVESWYGGWSDGTKMNSKTHVGMLKQTVKRIQGNGQSHVRRIGKYDRASL